MSYMSRVRDYMRDGMSEADAYATVAAERRAELGGEGEGASRTAGDVIPESGGKPSSTVRGSTPSDLDARLTYAPDCCDYGEDAA